MEGLREKGYPTELDKRPKLKEQDQLVFRLFNILSSSRLWSDYGSPQAIQVSEILKLAEKYFPGGDDIHIQLVDAIQHLDSVQRSASAEKQKQTQGKKNEAKPAVAPSKRKR